MLSFSAWHLLAAFVLHHVGVVIYRLFFHPLSKFPGPWYYAATPITKLVQHNVRGLFPLQAKELHDRYGDFVRVSPNTLSIEGPALWKDVLGHKPPGQLEWLRYRSVASLLPEEELTFVLYPTQQHRALRRVFGPAYSESAVLEQEPIIASGVDLLMTRLEETERKPTDICLWFLSATFDITADLIWGESFHSLETSEVHPFVKMTIDMTMNFFKSAVIYELPFLRPFLSLLVSKEHIRKDEEGKKLVYDRTRARMERGAESRPNDLMAHWLRNGVEKTLTDKELLVNVRIMNLAGSETVSTMLAGLTYYLTSTPRIYHKVVLQVRQAFATEQDITAVAAAKLEWLQASIDETLRLYPTTEMFERVSPGAPVGGQWIPKGTRVYAPLWSGHHRAVHFRDPDAFVPERWLPREHPGFDQRYANDDLKARQTFSAGPRNCVGRALAYAELRYIMARLLWRFDVELCVESEKWMEGQRLFISWEKGPLMVRVLPRKHDKSLP